MVSWGTTANLSVPVRDGPPAASPPGVVLSRSAVRGVAARGRAVGRGLPGGLDRDAHRTVTRDVGRVGGPEPARCPGRGGHAVAGGRPGSMVAGGRHGRVRRAPRRPRARRPGPGRLRGGGLGGAALPRGGRRPTAGGAGGRPTWSSAGPVRPSRVWVDVLTGVTGPPRLGPPFGSGGVGGGGPAGGAGRRDRSAPSTGSTRPSRRRRPSTARPEHRCGPTGPCGNARTGWSPPRSGWPPARATEGRGYPGPRRTAPGTGDRVRVTPGLRRGGTRRRGTRRRGGGGAAGRDAAWPTRPERCDRALRLRR